MSLMIILPCAGSGLRLGLKTHKELYEIIPGIKLIDFSLMHIKKYMLFHGEEELNLSVVIRESKVEVFDYVNNVLPEIRVNKVLFNEKYYEWAGSVYSAENFFLNKNIVLLPDSVIMVSRDNPYFDSSGRTLVEKMSRSLEKSKVSFGYVSCKDRERLRNLGALNVYRNKIISFQDKPAYNCQNYNAFWSVYGFRREYGGILYEFLVKSIRHEDADFTGKSFYPPPGVRSYSYMDLGTWESINNFRYNFNREIFEL